MSRRPGEWHLLGESSDPVPADEYDVGKAAQRYKDRARDLDDARSTLDRLSRFDGWSGEASEKFAGKAEEVLHDLGKARDKYADVARALERYSDRVATARDRTRAALDKAVDADRRVRGNASNPEYSLPVDATPQQRADASLEKSRHDDGAHDLRQARVELAHALTELGHAAQAAAREIRAASDRFKDNHWDDFKGWIRENADIILAVIKVLEIIAIIIAVVALVVAVVVGGALLAAIALIGVVIAAAVLLLRVALVVSESGKASWGDVAWDTVNLALTVVGGRAATQLAKGASKTVGGVIAKGHASVTKATREAMSPQVRNALKIKNPTDGLRVWAQRSLDEAAHTGQKTFSDLASVKAPWLSRLRMQDLALAKSMARIEQLWKLNVPGTFDDLVRAEVQLRHASQITIGNNVIGIVDGTLGRLDLPSLGGGVSAVTDGAVDALDRLRWRLTTAAR